MTGATHKQYAICLSFIVAMLIYKNGLTEVNYYLSIPILVLTAKYGGLFPDVDHHWDSVKEKTVPNWIINKIIHLTNGKHRSWQTHSIDIVTITSIISYNLPSMLFSLGYITNVNKEVMMLIMFGFMSGWVSHIISDMLTSAGVRLVCWNGYKVKFVPKKIGSLRFNTGNEWEKFNYKAMRVINITLGIIVIIYPFKDMLLKLI